MILRMMERAEGLQWNSSLVTRITHPKVNELSDPTEIRGSSLLMLPPATRCRKGSPRSTLMGRYRRPLRRRTRKSRIGLGLIGLSLKVFLWM